MATHVPPREGHESIAGISWLPRMIDKARLEAAGTIAQYDLVYPCPMDQRLLAQFGLSGETFQQIVLNAQSDQEIIEALKAKNAILT